MSFNPTMSGGHAQNWRVAAAEGATAPLLRSWPAGVWP